MSIVPRVRLCPRLALFARRLLQGGLVLCAVGVVVVPVWVVCALPRYAIIGSIQ